MSKTGLMPLAVLLLRRIAIRNPDRRLMARHHLVHDASGAEIIGLMHHRVLAVENPVIGIRPFDPDAGFVCGDDLGGANDGLRLPGLDLETGMRADEHVHQRDLAHHHPRRQRRRTTARSLKSSDQRRRSPTGAPSGVRRRSL